MNQAARTEELLRRLSGNTSGGVQLGKGRVAVVVSQDSARQPQGQLLATFLVNLLARLFPVVRDLDVYIPQDAKLSVLVPRWSARTLRATIEAFLIALDPLTKCQVGSDVLSRGYDCTLMIGDDLDLVADLFVGSRGWLAAVSSNTPQPVDGNPNPVGAYTAAAFGAAEVWKRLLFPHKDSFPGIPIVPIDGSRSFSCYDYDNDGAAIGPDFPEPVDIGDLTIIGLGAGGGAMAYTLASIENLAAQFLGVEPDETTDTGLNRAVCAIAADAQKQRPKADVIGDAFHANLGVSFRPVMLPFDDALQGMKPSEFKRVVAAVHSRAARRSIQTETPEILWDAGATETGEFYLWRVVFGKTQCLACRFDENGDPELEKAMQLQKGLGLSVDTWVKKLRDNERFTIEDIESIKARIEESDIDAELPSVGQRFGDWEVDQCGKLGLPDPDDEIPIPFAPVLAGVLVAGEVIKQALFPSAVLDSRYWNTLLGRFMPHNCQQRLPQRADCPICTRPAFVSQYHRRWANHLNAIAGAC